MCPRPGCNQAQTSHTGYDPIDGSSATGDTSGWTLGAVTSSTDAGGLVTYTRYNAAGQVVEQRLPGDSNGTTPRTTPTSYYAATGSGGCINAADAGLVCSTAPGGQPATGNPLPIVTYGYDMYGETTSKTETYGTGSSQVVRTTATGYDTAGRQTSSAVTVSPVSAGGTALPTVSYSYDPATGLPISTSTTSGGSTSMLTTGYDSLGQATSYTDATGNVSHTSYDLDGRPTGLNDGKGTTTYTYDAVSGQLTGEDVGILGSPSAFTASYDANGNLTSETYPNGLVATRSYDNAGELTDLAYAMNGTGWLDFSQDVNAQGQIVDQSSPNSAQTFSYDGSGRLTIVQDILADPSSDAVECTTRVYSFNADSDRTSLKSYPDAGTDPVNGACSTSTTPTSTSYSFDGADRLTSDTAGAYSYDMLGRTTTVPAADAAGIGSHAAATGAFTVGYYANDLVASQMQGSASVTFTLDPGHNRIASFTDSGTTTLNHYSDNSDSPAWTATGSSWTRNVPGIDGGLDATVTSAGTVTLELVDPHGDVVATSADSTSATSTSSYSESTEYGTPRSASNAYKPYGWLGGKQRSSNDLAGLSLMGVRLYNPATGRFLSVDPVPGGNANTYIYPDDPIDAFDLNGALCIFGHNSRGGCLGAASPVAPRSTGKISSRADYSWAAYLRTRNCAQPPGWSWQPQPTLSGGMASPLALMSRVP